MSFKERLERLELEQDDGFFLDVVIEEKLIARAANAIGAGASTEDVAKMLTDAGLSKGQAYLVYQAGKLIAKYRANDPKRDDLKGDE